MILIGKGRGLSAVFAKDAGNLKKNILQERCIQKVCLRETDKFGKTQKPGPGELAHSEQSDFSAFQEERMINGKSLSLSWTLILSLGVAIPPTFLPHCNFS